MSNQATSFLSDQSWLFLLFIFAWMAVWTVATFSLSRLSGWSVLANKFKAKGDIEGDKYRFVSGFIGRRFLPVNYGHCLSVTVGKAGLNLSLYFPFRLGSPPLFIPWSEVKELKSRRFLVLFRYTSIIVKDCWPQISFMGRAQTAVSEAFARNSKPANRHRDSWRNK